VGEIDTKLIKEWLDRGEILELAREEGITVRTATNRLSNDPKKRTKNMAFVEKAMQRALARKARMLAGQEKLKNLNA
jgi:hypothetical protein